MVDTHDLPDYLQAPPPERADQLVGLPASRGTLAEVEREYIARVLRETGGVVHAAAERLGVPRTTLNGKMRKLGISRNPVVPIKEEDRATNQRMYKEAARNK